MKGKRIPFDIQFLMESILTESPDRFSIDSQDAEKFKKLGINQKVGTVYWYDEEAYPFFIEPKDRIVIYRRGNTHGNMETMLGLAPRKTGSEASFSFAYEFSSMNGDIGFVSKSTASKCYFHGLKGNDLNAVREYIVKHAKYFEKLEIRGNSQGVEALEIAGRLWKEKNVISFWNDKDEVMPYMKEIFGFMKNSGVDIQKSLYEFIDSRGFYTHYELTGNLPDTKEKLSAEEKQELLAKKHLDKNKADYDTRYWDRQGQKAAKGFEFPAKADAAIPALEGRIKLKDLIKENPDFVKTAEAGKIANYYDGDAIAFFAFPQFSILNKGGVHYDMINGLRDIYNDISDFLPHPAEVEYVMDDKGFIISDSKGLLDGLQHGPLGDFFEKYSADYADDDSGSAKKGSSANQGAFRTKSGGLAGRVWTKKKIISFWNRKEDVVKRWNEIEKMFSDMGENLGDLDEYRVDWLERDISTHTPLTPASQVSSSNTEKNQETFLDKLFGDTKISDEDIKKLQGRLHTMSAKKKKEFMMAMGYKNVKAADIADKLGMTVAEFNHIMNVNEETNNAQ